MDHSGLILNALRAVNKGNTALTSQCNGQLIAGDRLHDGADHGDVHLQGALFLTLAILNKGGLEADRRGDILGRGVAGNQQVFTKSAGGFFIKICHSQSSFFLFLQTAARVNDTFCPFVYDCLYYTTIDG